MTTATDNFTGADGTQLPTYSANWTTTGNSSAGSFLLLSNGVTSPLAGGSLTLFNSYTGTFGDNQYSQLTVKQVPGGGELFGVAIRVTSGNCYYFIHDNGGWIFGKTVAFVVSAIGAGSGANTLNLNDVLRIEAVGSSIVAKINGVTVASATDTDIASGNPGLASISIGGSGTQFVGDDWLGSDAFGSQPPNRCGISQTLLTQF